MLSTFYKTVVERSSARLWAQADEAGEFMMVIEEAIQTNFGCSEAHRQTEALVILYIKPQAMCIKT
jgi:hypothetical protein